MNQEPTSSELALIVCEWPVIAAEVAVTEAECVLAGAPGSVLALARWRAAVRRLNELVRGAAVVARPAVVLGVAA
jgi:hypothetical protein